MPESDPKIAALLSKVSDDFSRSCLKGAGGALTDRENPLRLNFFATAMRILFEHTMDALAPNESVAKVERFKSDLRDGKPTRSQRIAYAIQGGLSETFVTQDLKIDPHPLRKRLMQALDECNKRIHERENNVASDLGDQDAVVGAILDAFSGLLDAIRDCRSAIVTPIEEALDEAAIQALLSETLQEIDELSTHYSIQDISIGNTRVHAIGAETIVYRSTGTIEVILQFGSNSDVRNDMGAEIEQSFPFVCDTEVGLADPWNLEFAEPTYQVDVGKWRDAMKPDDWEPIDEEE